MVLFIQEDNASPALMNCLSFAKLLTFPSLVLNIVAFNLSCSNRPCKILQSNVISK